MIADIFLGNTVGVVMTLILLAMSITLMLGKGSWLIAGFNALSEREKEKYDVVALCKFMGKVMLSVTFCTVLISFGHGWMNLLGAVLIVFIIIFSVYYANSKNKFIKE